MNIGFYPAPQYNISSYKLKPGAQNGREKEKKSIYSLQ